MRGAKGAPPGPSQIQLLVALCTSNGNNFSYSSIKKKYNAAIGSHAGR
jgi:hypothetical protein